MLVTEPETVKLPDATISLTLRTADVASTFAPVIVTLEEIAVLVPLNTRLDCDIVVATLVLPTLIAELVIREPIVVALIVPIITLPVFAAIRDLAYTFVVITFAGFNCVLMLLFPSVRLLLVKDTPLEVALMVLRETVPLVLRVSALAKMLIVVTLADAFTAVAQTFVA
jgi:hypothetical protein